MPSPPDRAALDRLAALPRAGIGHWPTPLDRLTRFEAALRATNEAAAGAEIYAKRDDVQGVALAGNKVRKFDLVLGQALAEGFDTLVTTGAIQSNSARAGAAAAAALGLDCTLLLSGREPAEPSANVLLDQLVGADVRFAGSVGWRELNDGVEQIVAELNAAGRKALAAPVGCSSPLGSLGFAAAFVELDAQLRERGLEPSAIVHTSTSGGTHAGLLVGRALTGRSTRIIAVDAGAIYDPPDAPLAKLAHRAAAEIDVDLDLGADDVEVLTSQVGERYGAHTRAATEAIRSLAATEAIITDPIYSGKGLAGLVELVAAGELSGPIVYWHTGGYHALFDPRHGPATAAGADQSR